MKSFKYSAAGVLRAELQYAFLTLLVLVARVHGNIFRFKGNKYDIIISGVLLFGFWILKCKVVSEIFVWNRFF